MFDGRVLGIDPGLTRCGYAIVDDGPRPVAVALGVVRTPRESDLAIRLAQLQVEIERLLDEYAPGSVAVERVFFQANVRTAMSVGQASGLVLAAAARRGCEVVQYTPTEVKETVAGWGAADKAQMQRMVQVRLALPRPPQPADAADAAGLALCHLARRPLARRLAERGVS